MYLALIILPILGSIVSGFFGRKVGVSGSHIITCTCVIITTLLAITAFFEVGFNNIPVSIYLFRWIDAESLFVSWAFNFDALTVSMLIPVLIVSSLVHVYSIGYMSHDPHNQRFFSYLSLFTFMMIILVTANNFLLMFVGWEGVGVCSYLLVSFWFTRIAANQSSLSAFLTNRVGDCFLTIGMFAILWSFGNVDYYTVFSLAPYYNENVILIVGICLLIGAMAKSSQVGLHVWLPMAMEGPTPVSALIHAATMVTAGVYLLMRSSPLIEYSSNVLLICLWIGAITTVFSSLIGLFQQDIKKVIAYSTMSQLGMMVIAIGLSSYNIALFHLVNHAFYKGLLFLGAGAVIHAVADNQDFRKYGGLILYLPLTYSVMLIASLSLVALPFMTGFYSKDFILESAFGQYHLSSIIVYFIAVIGAMFTTLYSVKVLYLTFLSNPNGPLVNYKKGHAAHEGDIFMSLPLIILAVFSIFFGYITKDIFIGLGSDFFSDNSLFIHPNHEIMLDTEFAVPIFYKLLPLFFTISLSIISILFTEFFPKPLIRFKFSGLGYNLFSFLNQRFLVELYYNNYISGLVLKLGGQTTKIMDKGSVEMFGPFGLERKLTDISKSIDMLSTGVVTSYALYILIGLISYIGILIYTVSSDEYLELLLILYALLYSVSKNETNTNAFFNYIKVDKNKKIYKSNFLFFIYNPLLSFKNIYTKIYNYFKFLGINLVANRKVIIKLIKYTCFIYFVFAFLGISISLVWNFYLVPKYNLNLEHITIVRFIIFILLNVISYYIFKNTHTKEIYWISFFSKTMVKARCLLVFISTILAYLYLNTLSNIDIFSWFGTTLIIQYFSFHLYIYYATGKKPNIYFTFFILFLSYLFIIVIDGNQIVPIFKNLIILSGVFYMADPSLSEASGSNKAKAITLNEGEKSPKDLQSISKDKGKGKALTVSNDEESSSRINSVLGKRVRSESESYSEDRPTRRSSIDKLILSPQPLSPIVSQALKIQAQSTLPKLLPTSGPSLPVSSSKSTSPVIATSSSVVSTSNPLLNASTYHPMYQKVEWISFTKSPRHKFPLDLLDNIKFNKVIPYLETSSKIRYYGEIVPYLNTTKDHFLNSNTVKQGIILEFPFGFAFKNFFVFTTAEGKEIHISIENYKSYILNSANKSLFLYPTGFMFPNTRTKCNLTSTGTMMFYDDTYNKSADSPKRWKPLLESALNKHPIKNGLYFHFGNRPTNWNFVYPQLSEDEARAVHFGKLVLEKKVYNNTKRSEKNVFDDLANYPLDIPKNWETYQSFSNSAIYGKLLDGMLSWKISSPLQKVIWATSLKENWVNSPQNIEIMEYVAAKNVYWGIISEQSDLHLMPGVYLSSTPFNPVTAAFAPLPRPNPYMLYRLDCYIDALQAEFSANR